MNSNPSTQIYTISKKRKNYFPFKRKKVQFAQKSRLLGPESGESVILGINIVMSGRDLATRARIRGLPQVVEAPNFFYQNFPNFPNHALC